MFSKEMNIRVLEGQLQGFYQNLHRIKDFDLESKVIFIREEMNILNDFIYLQGFYRLLLYKILRIKNAQQLKKMQKGNS